MIFCAGVIDAPTGVTIRVIFGLTNLTLKTFLIAMMNAG